MPEPTDDRAALREALLEQVAYLLDEVQALRPFLARLPEPLRTSRPLPDEPSIQECYGRLVAYDERRVLPWLRRVTKGNDAAYAVSEEQPDWNAFAPAALLDRVTAARKAVVAAFEALPPAGWLAEAPLGDDRVDAYTLAHRVTQHDADTLRTIGYRLHETHPASAARS